eukprot:PITA_01021
MAVLAEASPNSRNDGEEIHRSSWNSEGDLWKVTEKEEEERLIPIKEDPTTEDEYDEQSPIEQLALTVPTTDDPGIPVMTFRMWVLGILSCVILSFLNQFFGYRREPLTITAISAQIVVLPLGQLMAATMTRKKFFTGSKWEFSLNPGPFNMKEHVLITIFASAGAGSVQAIHIVNVVKIFYKKKLDFLVAFLIVMTTQILGFGWAGIFRKYLVEPAAMWWPANLVQVSLALHEEEERPKGSLTRNQFFVIVLICSFAYYVVPGYLFPMMTSLSWICWIFPKSVLAQQLGSGLYGLGMGSIGIDWSTISSYLGSPLASPWFAVANMGIGFVIVMYVLMPLAYWFDLYDAKTFPIFSVDLFTSSGQDYNISKIVDSNFRLDLKAYDKYGTLHLSIFFALSYGVSFATLTATVVHVLLFHGREIWHLSLSAFRDQTVDVHTRLMRKYKQVPESWFTGIIVSTVALTMFTCQYYIDQLQLPWWRVLLGCAIAIFFTLPIGIIAATTNQTPGLNVISEYIIGYIYPGRPVANICFKVYVYLGTAWWMMNDTPNICDTAVLSSNSPWTCPTDHVYYDASVIWGLIGPRRIFGNLGEYAAINWFFIAGAIAPVLAWLLHKAYPGKEWIRSINMPILIGATHLMPPATAVNYSSWIIVGFIFSFVIYRYKKDWWQRHNYVLSGGLDAGMALMAVLLYMCLGLENVTLKWWGENLDGCPLASCPTALPRALLWKVAPCFTE